MLKRWSIENFKSFRDRTDIPLASITVFAGANSSGKSTILQSILLLKQTVQFAGVNRPIALNGPLLKLGTFEDVKNAGASADHIGIGWQLEYDDTTDDSYRTYGLLDPWSYPDFYGTPTFTSIAAEFTWDVSTGTDTGLLPTIDTGRQLLQLQPRLASSDVHIVPRDEKLSTAYLSLRRSVDAVQLSPGFNFQVADIDEASRIEVLQSKPEGQIVGAATRYFFPAQIGVKYNATKLRAQFLAALICGTQAYYDWMSPELRKRTFPIEIARLIERRLSDGESTGPEVGELFPEQPPQDVPIESLINQVRRLRVRAKAQDVAELRQEIEKLLYEQEEPQTTVDAATTRTLSEAIEYSVRYFVSAVHYLGPLRDEPKPIYPLEALLNPTEVGFRGEHTAAVLDLHRDRTIRYLPSSFIKGEKIDLSPRYSSLHDAVVDWLTYVGVASDVSTSDRGKIGHQIQVATEGLARLHDLTNVGVGVSQVLPIIVMALLSARPSLLIFEQPELHLHPKVQARLADFFLSIALSGKQCLLETHSEYLIERFRRRVAESSGDFLTSMLKIFFTERVAGDTKCREVEVSKYGAIADWPRDFFDQSQIETELILKAAAAKRSAERAAR